MNYRLTPLRVAAAVAVLSLAGCASFSPEGSLLPAPAIQNAADEQRVADRVRELLAQPLDADRAVQIALLNNRGLQASLQEIGIAEAEMVQASRLPNPGFGFARLTRSGGDTEIDRSFSFDIARLITLPMARDLEAQRLTATQRAVSLEMFNLTAETRKAFYAAVAAEQGARYQHDVQGAAEAGAELAKRMVAAGNWSTLQQAREQGFAAEAALAVARADQQRVATRERLTRLLGLASSSFTLPERLPDLPEALSADPDVEQSALDQRLDIQQAKALVEAQAKNIGLTRTTRFINLLDLGYQRNTETALPRQTGYELRVEIPLFDWGDARVKRSEALYQQTVQRAAQVAIDARSELRETTQARRSAFDIAKRYRDDLVPLAKKVSDENQLRYNGMLISVFELLADARAQVAAVNAAIEAQRDFWIAQAELDMARVGKPIASR